MCVCVCVWSEFFKQFKVFCCYWFSSIPLPGLWNLCGVKINVAWLEWKQKHAHKKHPHTWSASGAPPPELPRLGSGLNASAAACEAKGELRKRPVVEEMLRFGYERGYLRNRMLNDVNLWASVYPPKKTTKKILTTRICMEHPGASSYARHSEEARFNQTWTFNVQQSEIRRGFLKDRVADGAPGLMHLANQGPNWKQTE